MNIDAAIRGLALGDMYSPQSSRHRLHLVGARRVRRFEFLTSEASSNRHTTIPAPYVNGYPQELLKPRPSDDCEWFHFAQTTVRKNLSFADEWRKLAAIRESLLTRAGTHAALRNISHGKLAPVSGHDNTHYFDDLSLIHAIAIATIPGLSNEKIHQTLIENISHTHSEDGIWCANALAEFVLQLKDGKPIQNAMTNAMKYLPKDSWSLREIKKAETLTEGISDNLERVFHLENYFVDRIYAYPYGAPETLALLLAHLQHFEDPGLFFATSFLHPRHTDSLPPLMGFFAGLLGGKDWIPTHHRTQSIELDGVCIPHFKGEILI